MKDLERGLSNKGVAKKIYDVPKNTISTWTKNKTSYFDAQEQSSSKRKKLRDSDYKQLDQVVIRWFLSQRSQNISIDGVFIKGKALQYANKLGYNEFQASDGCLRRWIPQTFTNSNFFTGPMKVGDSGC